MQKQKSILLKTSGKYFFRLQNNQPFPQPTATNVEMMSKNVLLRGYNA
ncbi:hypothetical protein [Chitinophaga sp. 212800010-3]